MPYNSNQITYRQRLNPWAIAQLRPNMQRTIVGRFRSRSDADGHLRCLRQLIPHASFVVVFDPQPDEETVSVFLATAQKAVKLLEDEGRRSHPNQVGAGLGTKFRYSLLREQQNPPFPPINKQQNPPSH